MPAIRVYLLTCRRPHLLPRALESLRRQTCADWICELHNDDPDDESPRRLLAELADPRITLHSHERAWGPVAAFNHAFAGGPEPYLSILEDDNWWEPDFLATALAALQSRPDANVAWANQRIWRENPDHTWTDTGDCIWQRDPADERPRLFHWPVPIQCFDALHSNGAMLCRASASRRALVPPDTPFAVIEPVRERLLPGGWLLLPRPLGNFARTLSTARSPDPGSWICSQLLVAASHLLHENLDPRGSALLWETLRAQRPPATNMLFLLALRHPSRLGLLRFAGLPDWSRFAASFLRRPRMHLRAMRYRSEHPGVWRAINAAALARRSENPRPTGLARALYTKDLRSDPPA